MDRPEAFGQHPNADIAYQIEDSKVVLDSLLALQPRAAAAVGGKSREELVMGICNDLLEQVGLTGSILAHSKARIGASLVIGHNPN